MRATLLRWSIFVAVLLLSGCGEARNSGAPTIVSGGTARASVEQLRTATRPTTPTLVIVPADFAFVYSTTKCEERNEINTFDNTYTNFVPQNAYNAGTRTVVLTLIANDLHQIYRVMLAIKFFSYPGALDTSEGDGRSASDNFYRVRVNNQLKELRWTDKHPLRNRTTPVSQTISDLYTLNNLLYQVSLRYSEVQQIKRGAGCT